MTDLVLSKVGINGMRFGTHSFRIKAASTAAVMGYLPDDIKQLGDGHLPLFKDIFEHFLMYRQALVFVFSGPIRTGRCRQVVILGHSFVFWSAKYAAQSAWGSDLGLGDRAQIEWKGIRGLLWCQVCRMATFGTQPPDVLLIHLRGNDLAKFGGKALILDVLRDLR